MIEAARAEIQDAKEQSKLPQSLRERLLRRFVFGLVLPSPGWLRTIGSLLWFYEASGVSGLARNQRLVKLLGQTRRIEPAHAPGRPPCFFSQIRPRFPAEGERRYRVALLAGCIANIFFARLHEATLRVLQHNGCEVVVPPGQACCGALHLHSGLRGEARALARRTSTPFAAATSTPSSATPPAAAPC